MGRRRSSDRTSPSSTSSQQQQQHNTYNQQQHHHYNNNNNAFQLVLLLYNTYLFVVSSRCQFNFGVFFYFKNLVVRVSPSPSKNFLTDTNTQKLGAKGDALFATTPQPIQ